MGHTLNQFKASIGIFSCLVVCSLASSPFAQIIPGKGGYRFISEGGQPIERLLSNSVIDIVPDSLDVVMGTGGGLSVWHTTDSTWSSFGESFGLGQGSVSALGVKNGVIWAATAYTASTSVGYLPAGGGVGFSADGGFSWTWYDQPIDPDTITTYEPTTTNIQNVTYDLLITSTDIWIASWGGGLRKFSFADSAWHLVTPDTQAFSALDHLNHRAFAVAGDDSILWVGTAAGIDKSTDGGQSWENFDHGDGLSGNFITALGLQIWGAHEILWAASWPAEASGESYGVSMTENGGLSWSVPLSDSVQSLKAHNFAFDDSAVYVASNLGLYKSVYPFTDWQLFPPIQDSETGEVIYDPEVYSALMHKTLTDTTLWVGTADGIAASPNYGNTWTIFHAEVPTTDPGQPSTYAKPNPFSPRLSPYVCRFQYHMPVAGKVTLKIYDFAMDLVSTVVDGAIRDAGDHYEQWLGTRNEGRPVATGVYYYCIERGGMSTVWGKVAVIY